MVNHEYWLDIYPTGKFDKPWRVEVTDTRLYRTVEKNEYKTEDEVIAEVKSWWKRYGKSQVRVGEHVYYISPNKRFAELGLWDEEENDESGTDD